MHTTTDEQLILAIQKGNISAYETLIKRYQRGLLFFVLRIVKSESVAADIAQDSLVKIYLVIDSIDVTRKFSTFLFEIAKNASLSYIRNHKRLVSLDVIADIEDDESFIERYMRDDMIEKVRMAVKSIEEKYRRVIQLYYFEELSYEEIGERLHIPVNTIRTHLKRAKELLKKRIVI